MIRLESSLMSGVRIATGCLVSSSLLPDGFMLHVFMCSKRGISTSPDISYFVFAFGSSVSPAYLQSLLLILFFLLQLFVFCMPLMCTYTHLCSSGCYINHIII